MQKIIMKILKGKYPVMMPEIHHLPLMQHRLPLTSGQSPLSMAQDSYNNQDRDRDGSWSREARYRNLLEQRSDFLERRRRIRSQVRALQRLGSRFENLSVHERSCILTRQHRTGQCACQSGNRHDNSNEDNNARASISRIVMLAEALFEVLDEIHQQSVVLSSRQSVSSIGSVPGPIEVVGSLPVKLYTKLQKHQNYETAHGNLFSRRPNIAYVTYAFWNMRLETA